jgi:hypothetical protein
LAAPADIVVQSSLYQGCLHGLSTICALKKRFCLWCVFYFSSRFCHAATMACPAKGRAGSPSSYIRSSVPKHRPVSMWYGNNIPSCWFDLPQSCICFGQLQPIGESSPGSAMRAGALVRRTRRHTLTYQKQLVKATSRTLYVPRTRMCAIHSAAIAHGNSQNTGQCE